MMFLAQAIDLMEKCLTFSPRSRIEVGEALQHPYLQVGIDRAFLYHSHTIRSPQPYHDPLDEPVAKPLDPSFFDFDYGENLGKEQLKGSHPHVFLPSA